MWNTNDRMLLPFCQRQVNLTKGLSSKPDTLYKVQARVSAQPGPLHISRL